jgi:hypothetical protein
LQGFDGLDATDVIFTFPLHRSNCHHIRFCRRECVAIVCSPLQVRGEVLRPGTGGRPWRLSYWTGNRRWNALQLASTPTEAGPEEATLEEHFAWMTRQIKPAP